MSIKCIIFDFGNVVGYFDHWKACEALAQLGSGTADEIYDYCFNNQLEDDLEAGRIGTEEFISKLSRQFGLGDNADRIERIFGDIFWPNDEIATLLPVLKPNYRLLVGSNTSVLHSRQFKRQFAETLRHFDDLVLSHDIGARKPSRAFYEQCVKKSRCRAGECAFIDDLPVNVGGAEACGLHGILYQCIEDLKAQLKRLSVAMRGIP
jgi:putative hydrolase of the HAD superfamily